MQALLARVEAARRAVAAATADLEASRHSTVPGNTIAANEALEPPIQTKGGHLSFECVVTIEAGALNRSTGPRHVSAAFVVRKVERPAALPAALAENLDCCTGDAPCRNDYLGIFASGAVADGSDLSRAHFAIEFTNGDASGTVTLPLPRMPGQFEVAYVHHSGVCAGVSAPFDVDSLGADVRGVLSTATEASKTRTGKEGGGSWLEFEELAVDDDVLRQWHAATSSETPAASEPPPAETSPAHASCHGAGNGRSVDAAVSAPALKTASVSERVASLASSKAASKWPTGEASARNVDAAATHTPPFFLELLPNIGVYQLAVPLPSFIRGASGPPVGRLSVSSRQSTPFTGSPTSSSPLLPPSHAVLPPQWKPALFVHEGAAAAALATQALHSGLVSTDGARPLKTALAIVEVVFELPCRTAVLATCELAATGSRGSAEPLLLSPASWSSLPRNSYRLLLPLPQRVATDAASLAVSVHADHFSARIPLYYRGAMTLRSPESKAPSSISGRELHSLRGHAASLACRSCRALLLMASVGALPAAPAHRASSATGASDCAHSSMPISEPDPASRPASTALRVAVLPSEHWLEWSEFWMCHEEERHVMLPDADYGATRGTVLVGESTLQLHLADVDGNAMLLAMPASGTLVPSTTATATTTTSQVVSGASSGITSGVASEVAELGTHEQTLQCRRCRAVLGALHCRQAHVAAVKAVTDRKAGSASWQANRCTVTVRLQAVQEALGVALPDAVSKHSGPYLALHKDSLWMAEANALVPPPKSTGSTVAKASAGSDAAATAPAHAAGPLRNAFVRHSAVTRVGERVLSALIAHGRYSFLLAAQTGVAGDGSLAVKAQASDVDAARASTVPRLSITVLCWDAKVVFQLPLGSMHDSDQHDGGGVGYNYAASRLSRDFHLQPTGMFSTGLAQTGGVVSASLPAPAMRVQFQLLPGQAERSTMAETSSAAAGGAGATIGAKPEPEPEAALPVPAGSVAGVSVQGAQEDLLLSMEDFVSVCQALQASNTALPPSRRTLAGALLGYIPLATV